MSEGKDPAGNGVRNDELHFNPLLSSSGSTDGS